jgi:hypothetical protein
LLSLSNTACITDVVKWISRHHYNKALIDGNTTKPILPQVAFCKEFI